MTTPETPAVDQSPNPVRKLLLNTGKGGAAVSGSTVSEPAFSLTKVNQTIATVLAVAAAALGKTLTEGTTRFTPSNYTAIAVALFGVLAVTQAADVLARGHLAAAKLRAEAEKETASTTADARLRMLTFPQPFSGKLAITGGVETVSVLAISDAQPATYLVVRSDNTLQWKPAADITLA